MPSISIDVNQVRIATIDLTGRHLLNVLVHGALDREQKAELDAMGGTYTAGASGHLLWVPGHALQPGDVVHVSLNQDDVIGDPGQTLAQCYPGQELPADTDFSISEAMAAEIRARPRLHDGFLVQVATSSGAQASASSDARHTDFSFSLLWDHFRPGQARVRLASNCLDDVLARTGGREHLQTMIYTGQSATFSLVQ